MDTRVCPKCHKEKPLEAFYPKKKQACKTCIKAKMAEYYIRHKAQRNAASKAWYDAHQQQCQDYANAYHKAHPDIVAAWHKANKDKRRRNVKRWRDAHPEKVSRLNKEWRMSHQESYAIYQAAYREVHRAKILARQLAYQSLYRDYYADIKRAYRARRRNAPIVERFSLAEIAERDQWTCQLCFKAVVRREASIDHVIPLSKGGDHSRRNVVLAHRRCNARKGNRPIPQQQRLF